MTRCEFHDAIVARHLDGDVACPEGVAFGWQPDALADHLRDCAACQQYLQRSRRLDAVLAEASGRAAGGHAEVEHLERLLERALAQAVPPTPAPPAQPARRLRPLVTAAGLLAAGFLAALWFVPRPEPVPSLPPPVAAPEPAPPPEGDHPPSPLPDRGIPVGNAPPGAATAPASLGAPRARGDVERLCAVLGDAALPDRLDFYTQLHLRAAGVAAPVGATAATADGVRRRCSALLLDSALPLAVDAWLRTVAGLDRGPLLEGLLADARRRPQLLARVRARLLSQLADRPGLDDLACLTMAARLGGRELDAAVRTAVRRDGSLGEVLAAALRTPFRRDGRAALLLDVFGDFVARGAADDERLARALFAGQPPAVVPELLYELQQSRQSPRRVRCLLALGAAGDPQALPALLQALRGPVQTEALAAAFALGELPPAALADLGPQAERGPQAWLLRAALCHAGVPRALAWVEELELSAAERELLGVGGFTFAQFPVFAALLRERAPAAF